jgi:hypothetical protein
MEVDAALSSIETKYSFKFKEFGFAFTWEILQPEEFIAQ